jgi:Fe2+ or Zn2+ uptake regulation protein
MWQKRALAAVLESSDGFRSAQELHAELQAQGENVALRFVAVMTTITFFGEQHGITEPEAAGLAVWQTKECQRSVRLQPGYPTIGPKSGPRFGRP